MPLSSCMPLVLIDSSSPRFPPGWHCAKSVPALESATALTSGFPMLRGHAVSPHQICHVLLGLGLQSGIPSGNGYTPPTRATATNRVQRGVPHDC